MRRCAFILGFAALLSSPAAAQRSAPAPARAAPPAAPAPAPAPAPGGSIGMPVRMSVRTLIGICNENHGACLTYVLGAIDAFVATSVVNYGQTYLCFPPAVTNQQVANVAIAFLRAHPEAPDANAALVVLQGVRTAFPCH
jgi:hypothetical protein